MIRETQVDNIAIAKIMTMKDIKSKESDLLSIVEVITDEKLPIIPIIQEDGELLVNELRLNEEYFMKEEIEIKLADTYADLKCKKEFIDFAFDRKKSSHFNKILCTELEKTVNTATDLFDLLSKRHFNNDYYLIVNEDIFATLLKMKNANDEPIMKVENGKYMINGVTVAVAKTATKIILVDLNEVICKVIGDVVEVKNVETVRNGKRLFSANYDFGIGVIDTGNVFISNSL